MPKIRAFVGRSFDPFDDEINKIFTDYLNTYRKLGLDWEDAAEAYSLSVAQKVKNKFREKQAFIGIFTKKYQLHRKEKQKLNPQNKSSCYSFLQRTPSPYNCSTWTLQESGYAIGKDLSLILLVEDGVVDIGGLQGDFEIVKFNRKNPTSCFHQLAQQISNLLKDDESPPASSSFASIPPKNEEASPVPTVQDVEDGARDGESERDYFEEIKNQIADSNIKRAEQIKAEWLEDTSEEEKKVRREAIYLSLLLREGNAEYYGKLLGLANEHLDNPAPSYFLGLHLKFIGEYEKAAEWFIRAGAAHQEKKFDYNLDAIYCYISEKSFATSIELLKSFFPNLASLPEDQQFKVNIAYADIAEGQKNYDDEVSFLERALQIRPFEHEVRFRLAFQYNKIGKNENSLQHYKILVAEVPDSSNLNNLGVVYDSLNMNSLSVESYQHSTEMGGTLSIANIAKKYINEGFLKDAESVLEGARTIENYHPNVNHSLSRIDEKRTQDLKKEEKIIESSKIDTRFSARFAELVTQGELMQDFCGLWETPYGALEIKSLSNKILINADVPVREELKATRLFRGPASESIGKLEMSAEVTGRTAKGNIKITEDSADVFLAAFPQDMKIVILQEGQDKLSFKSDNKNEEKKYFEFKRRPVLPL